MQANVDHKSPITGQPIQYNAESAIASLANLSISTDPKPQLTHATDGMQSGSTFSERDIAGNASRQRRKKYRCQQCPRIFSDSNRLFGHLRVHTGATTYERQCRGEPCSDSSSLKSHPLRIHRGETSYQCLRCDLSFRSLHHLETHLRNHTVLCECQLCGKKFKQSASLASHLRTHTTGETAYQCGKKFSVAFNLTRHLRIHTGEMP